MTAYPLTEILAVAAKLKKAKAIVSGAPAHSRVEFGPVNLLTARERDIAVNLPDLLIQYLPKRRDERPSQPEVVQSGQVWQSRASGGQIKVAGIRFGNVSWDRVAGRGHRSGSCYIGTLREKYDYVEG